MPTHLFHNHEDKREDVTFVVDVLDMWAFIETGFRKLSKKDKERIATEVDGVFRKHVEFFGFDEHTQSGESGLLHIARFMINELGSFKSAFGGRDLNSHMPMADQYRRMYRVFEPIRESLVGTTLSADQLIKILKAAKAQPGSQLMSTRSEDFMALLNEGKVDEARAMIETEKLNSEYAPDTIETTGAGKARCTKKGKAVELGGDGKWRLKK